MTYIATIEFYFRYSKVFAQCTGIELIKSFGFGLFAINDKNEWKSFRFLFWKYFILIIYFFQWRLCSFSTFWPLFCYFWSKLYHYPNLTWNLIENIQSNRSSLFVITWSLLLHGTNTSYKSVCYLSKLLNFKQEITELIVELEVVIKLEAFQI